MVFGRLSSTVAEYLVREASKAGTDVTMMPSDDNE